MEAPTDSIVLGGARSPGLCDVVGAERKKKLDVLNAYGQTGARVIYHGDELCRFSVRFRFYAAEELDEWALWSQVLYKAPAPRHGTVRDQSETKDDSATGAYSITHPLLAEIGVSEVIVESVLAPEQTDDGEWTIEVKFIEYRPPVKALAAPKGAQATPADPDPVDQDIGVLNQHVKDLFNELAR